MGFWKQNIFPSLLSRREWEKEGTPFSHILHVTDPDNRGPSIFPNKLGRGKDHFPILISGKIDRGSAPREITCFSNLYQPNLADKYSKSACWKWDQELKQTRYLQWGVTLEQTMINHFCPTWHQLREKWGHKNFVLSTLMNFCWYIWAPGRNKNDMCVLQRVLQRGRSES